MDGILQQEVDMSTCAVCNSRESRSESVDEVFRVDGKYVLVEGIPADVCARCGEQVISRETAEKVRLMVHGQARATTSVSMQVFDFAR